MNHKTPHAKRWLFAVLAFLAVACKSKEWDISPLKVVETTPAANATQVPVTTKITATFNKKIKPLIYSVTVTTAGQSVAGSTSATDTAIVFTPAAPLKADSDYLVVIAGTVEDSASNPMGGEYRWRFQTASISTWHTFLGGSGQEEGRTVVQAADGGYAIVTSYTFADIPMIQGVTSLLPYPGNPAPVVVKLTPSGNVSWYTFLGGSINEQYFDLAATSDGGFIVSGRSAGYSNLAGKAPINPPSGGFETVVIKLAADGQVSWYTFFGAGGTGQTGSSVKQTNDGGYIAVGSPGGNIPVLNGHNPVYAYSNLTDAVVVKLSAAGTVDWYTFIGGAGDEVARFILQCADGGYLAGVASTSSIGNFGGATPLNASAGNYDLMLVRLTNSGTLVWYTYLGSSSQDSAVSGIQTRDGGFALASQSGANVPNLGGAAPLSPYVGNGDFWIIKLSGTGSVLWHTFLGSTAGDSALALVEAYDQSLTVVGTANANVSLSGLTPKNPYSANADTMIVNLTAQGTVNWYTFFGDAGGNQAQSIIQTVDGAYVIGGLSSNVPSYGGKAPLNPHSGSYDLFVLRLRGDGSI